jgi:hypothetical protein
MFYFYWGVALWWKLKLHEVRVRRLGCLAVDMT